MASGNTGETYVHDLDLGGNPILLSLGFVRLFMLLGFTRLCCHIDSRNSIATSLYVYSTRWFFLLHHIIRSLTRQVAFTCTWLSTDGGNTWVDVADTPNIFEFADSGATILMGKHYSAVRAVSFYIRFYRKQSKFRFHEEANHFLSLSPALLHSLRKPKMDQNTYPFAASELQCSLKHAYPQIEPFHLKKMNIRSQTKQK